MGQEGKRDEGGAWGGDSGPPQHLGSLARRPWRRPVPFRWNTLGSFHGQGRGHWGPSQVWGLGTTASCLCQLGPVTSHFTSLSQFPCRDSNTYLTRPLEGWELSENAYKMLRTLSGI